MSTNDLKKEMTLPDVIIRRARREDYDDVMSIGDVYCGRDYLPSTFLCALEDPDIYPLVAEAVGHVIGFYMNHILDNGLSVIKRDGRVHNDYRGLGIFHLMSDGLDKDVEERHPGVMYRLICAGEAAAVRGVKEFQETGFLEVIKKPVRSLSYSVKDLVGLDTPKDLTHVIQLTHDDMRDIFSMDDVVEKLFPEKRILNFFIGYRCVEDNIRHFIEDRKEVFATTSHAQQLGDPPQRGRTRDALKEIDMVSFSVRFPGTRGLMYVIDIYAKDGSGHAALDDHVTRHLRSMKSATQDGGVLFITFGNNVPEAEVLSCLKRHGISELYPGVESWKALYEKKVR
ncbi:unnamed protein product [Lymnaea stagnalis]|uniref:Histidine N-acetyltransferase C-terminal domain-containing protein n=1 Tax=Lymnaea stagnalis TaxID=6523 RepID=A0AAV2IHH2_LYMST